MEIEIEPRVQSFAEMLNVLIDLHNQILAKEKDLDSLKYKEEKLLQFLERLAKDEKGRKIDPEPYKIRIK